MKRTKLTPQEWQEKHPKCETCKYSEFHCPLIAGLPIPSYYTCAIKDKIVYPKLPRWFCQCYEWKNFKLKGE